MRKLKYTIFALVLLFAEIQLSSLALAEVNDAFYFLDSANVLSEPTKIEIYNANQFLTEQCGAQIAIVVLEDISGASIGKYATGMGDLWGVGERGFLLLITTSNNDHHAYVGKELKDAFPSEILQQMTDEYLEPDLLAGNCDAAVRKYFEAVFSRLAGHFGLDAAGVINRSMGEARDRAAEPAAGFKGAIPLAVGIILILLICAVYVVFRRASQMKRGRQ